MASQIPPDLLSRFFADHTPESFNGLCLEIFSFQYQNNRVYRIFCDELGISPAVVRQPDQIPFLPVEIFKTQRVVSLDGPEKMRFRSSGTSETGFSEHAVFLPDLYERSIIEGFQRFFGNPSRYAFACLTPSPAQKPDSSLAFMAGVLMKSCAAGGFFQENKEGLWAFITENSSHQLLVLGLSFALADLAESGCPLPSGSIVLETGGMKGRRKELRREDLHGLLKRGLGIAKVGSEYSMCELFSQAWAEDGEWFRTPPWMKILIRNLQDPLEVTDGEAGGGINVIDLANIATCSFIATGDRGKLKKDGCFMVNGRIRPEDLKGCALFAEPEGDL